MNAPRRGPEGPRHPQRLPTLQALRPTDALAEAESRYRQGGIDYGEMKTRLGEAIVARFAPTRERRADWLAHPDRVAEVRAAAAERARKTARVVLDRARAACGVD
jgi:tryptophanyl-tRNA synthetase